MRKNQLLSVLSLFLLVHASITRAQTVTLTGTVSIEQDYRVVNFHSSKGNLNVILPGALSSPGQGTVTLSGTVMAEPAGKTEKEKSSNLKALQKMLLTIGGKSITILPGQNHFDFSLPRNLTTPVPIDLADPGGNRATVMLKNLAVSPPPMTSALAPGQASLFTDQKVYLTNGNIPVYAANNTSTLFQPSDKFFIKDASGNMTEATKIAQCPTQTVLSSQGIQPGTTTIVRQSGNRTDQVNVRMANLTLSSPNTNLRNGQTSTLTVTIDPKITDKDSAEAMQIPIMSFDVKNLKPGVIDMAGGNLQVMTFPKRPNSTNPADWQITRTITGITPGNFNISATLYPSSDISTNVANTQKKALTTAEEFNKWIEGVKKYLQDLLDNANGEYKKNEILNAMRALPYCNSDEDLELCKTTADIALRFFTIPNQDLASGLPAMIAYQAEANHLLNQATRPDVVHTDVIQNGLNYLQQASKTVKNQELVQNITTAQQATTALNNDYSAKNISALSSALQQLNNSAFIADIIKQNGVGNNIKQPIDSMPPVLYSLKFDPFAPLDTDKVKPAGLTLDNSANAPFTYSHQCGETINLTYNIQKGDEQGILQIKNTGQCPLNINIFTVGGGGTSSILGIPQVIPAADGKQAAGLSYLTFSVDLPAEIKSIKITIVCKGDNTSNCSFTGEFSVGGKDNKGTKGGRRTSATVTMLPVDFVSPQAQNENSPTCFTKGAVLMQFFNTSKKQDRTLHFTAESDKSCPCPFFVYVSSTGADKSFSSEQEMKEITGGDYSSSFWENTSQGQVEKNEGNGKYRIPHGLNAPVFLIGQCLNNTKPGCCRGKVRF